MVEYAPDNDDELETLVRDGLTDYSDSPDELPAQQFQSVRKIAMLRLRTKVGSDDWYSDEGLGQALLGVTAIHAKAQVENFSIDSWSIGDQSITVSGADEGGQFQLWNDLVKEGLEASAATQDSSDRLRDTASFIERDSPR